MALIRICESDDFIVDYDKERGMYRVSIFEDYHFKDEIWFDAYEEKEVAMTNKDLQLKETLLKLIASIPNQTKENVDAKIQFDKETNELINNFANIDLMNRDTSEILDDLAKLWDKI